MSRYLLQVHHYLEEREHTSAKVDTRSISRNIERLHLKSNVHVGTCLRSDDTWLLCWIIHHASMLTWWRQYSTACNFSRFGKKRVCFYRKARTSCHISTRSYFIQTQNTLARRRVDSFFFFHYLRLCIGNFVFYICVKKKKKYTVFLTPYHSYVSP